MKDHIRQTPEGIVAWSQREEPWIDHDEGVRVIPREDGGYDYEPWEEMEAWEGQPWAAWGCLAFMVGSVAAFGLLARWLLS